MNGYENRETYDVVLHITNDKRLYQQFKNSSVIELRGAFRDLFQDLIERPEQLTIEMRRLLVDVGREWRVNWFEVANALNEGDKQYVKL